MNDTVIVKRGHIYEFEPKNEMPEKVFALAVSTDARATDNIVNVIVLTPKWNTVTVHIEHPEFPEGGLYINCGKLTFTERWRLKRDVFALDEPAMERVDRFLCGALGLFPERMLMENIVYREVYEDLLEKVLNHDM